ncbi:ribonuclease H-like domain-containing protein [Niallia sp.]|uniref:ribonuclease H-like domain-containing protein n=1 Tax=Niallia sp. TaxID=2837523 RepID=UPI0028985C3E|nr:ribonuclease H-like domain-containing protein [Niallia sp.]
MSIKNKLSRMKSHIKKEEQTVPVKNNELNGEIIPFIEQWEQENVHSYWLDQEYCLIREVRYPLDYKHGNYTFREFCHVVDEWNKVNYDHPLSAKGHQAKELFFFDTETTGLGGGAGNTIFILGYAQLIENEIVLKQHILPHPGAEVPLFNSFLENVDYTTLVTYNGKAFDWPQVKTRHTLIKEHVPKLPEFGHFDLYHGARRMWKHRLDRTKLAIVEEEILGVKRKDDIPGFLAPMIYFDFVERKNPEGMLGILKHNEIDILSLITLYTHLSYQLLRKDQKISAKEALEVGKWYAVIGQTDIAKQNLQSIKEQDKEEVLEAAFLLAKEFKREKKFEDASALWRKIVETYSNETKLVIVLHSLVELAKLAEHKEKNLHMALIYTNKAQQLVNNQYELEKVMLELQKRRERLERKLHMIKRNQLFHQ